MSNPDSNTSTAVAKGRISLPARVNIADTLRAILYSPGTVIMSVKTDGIRCASNLSAVSALAGRKAAAEGDNGNALSHLLSGTERKVNDKVGEFSFRRAADDATIALALANYST